MTDIEEIRSKLRKFAQDRDWEKFHSPKNLAMALSVEAAELLEHFQWLTEEESRQLDGKRLQEVADEIADIQVYLLMISDALDVDIKASVVGKIEKNAAKYPTDKVRGSKKKYTEY